MIVFGRGSGKFAQQLQSYIEQIVKSRAEEVLSQIHREDVNVISDYSISSHVMYIMPESEAKKY